MAEAERDENRVTTIIAVSKNDPAEKETVVVAVNPVNNAIIVEVA